MTFKNNDSSQTEDTVFGQFSHGRLIFGKMFMCTRERCLICKWKSSAHISRWGVIFEPLVWAEPCPSPPKKNSSKF